MSEPTTATETEVNKALESEPVETSPSQKDQTVKAKLVVHHLNNSRSQRILWLLEELQIPYEIKKYNRTEEQLAPEELTKIHPLGKAPVITDGDVVVAESGAIVEYLISQYGAQFQASPASRVTDLYWVHYSEGTLMPLLVNKYIFTLVPKRAPLLLRPIINVVFKQLQEKMVDPRLKQNGDMIEDHLSKSTSGWFAGEAHPTAADFMMSFPLEAFASRYSGGFGPKTKSYVDMIHKRPAYIKALEKGGKYDYA